jgi:hypothetical protein
LGNDLRDVREIDDEVTQVGHERQPRLPEARIVGHDEHFREESINGPRRPAISVNAAR